jgi:hypothetical protein
MMRLYSIFIVLCSFVGQSTTSLGAAQEQRVKLLLQYKQARALFANPTEDFKKAIERRSAYTPMTAQRKDRVSSIAEKIYRQDNLYGVLVAAYAAFASPRAVEAEIQMFESPVGRLYRQSLAESTAADFKDRVANYWQTRKLVSMKANRKNAISSFMKKTRMADAEGTYMAGMDIGVDLSLNAFKKRRYRLSLKKIKDQTKLRKNNYVMDNADDTLQTMTFAFRDIKNQQIDWITQFYLSRSGEVAVETFLNAIEVTMDRAGETLMHNLNADTKKPIQPPAALAAPKPQTNKKTVQAPAKDEPSTKKKKPSLLYPKK